MIRLNIQRKVFLATIALTTAMALLLLGLTRWSLEQGFAQYVAEAETSRLGWLVGGLESAYAEHGNWDFMRGNSEAWDQIHRNRSNNALDRPRAGGEQRQAPQRPAFDERNFPPRDGQPAGRGDWRGPPDHPPGPQDGERQDSAAAPRFNDRPPPRPVDPLGIKRRLAVLDAQGKLVAGNPAGESFPVRRALRHHGEVVGSLALQAPQTSNSTLDAAFLASQNQKLLLSGLAALALSLLAAWLLARHFVGPIRELAAGARAIAAGRFSQPIAVRRSDELGELAADFNTMADMLARTEESRRQWIADTSHELRTPIAVLRAEIEAIQDGVRQADEATLARLHKQSMQLAKLVDDLRQSLDTAQESMALDLGSVQPVALVRETIDEFRDRYWVAKISIDTEGLQDGAWTVRGDADRLHQVFANLLENTLRYTESSGRLRIRAGAQNGWLRMDFDDTPPAPPEEVLPRLFERFFRAEPSRSRAHGGSGLGLAICKTLIEAHGGNILAAKSDLGGLSMRLRLPLEK